MGINLKWVDEFISFKPEKRLWNEHLYCFQNSFHNIRELKDINKLIKSKFSGGLSKKRKLLERVRSENACFSRYAYSDRFAAECHVIRDGFLNREGYGFVTGDGWGYPPHIEIHKENGKEWFEVRTK